MPMPTFVFEVALLTPLILPSTRELLRVTLALEPMAVALVIVAAAFARAPIKVLLLSPVFDNPL